jgi:hypothetical protein
MTTPDQLRNQRQELETPAGATARFPSFKRRPKRWILLQERCSRNC